MHFRTMNACRLILRSCLAAAVLLASAPAAWGQAAGQKPSWPVTPDALKTPALGFLNPDSEAVYQLAERNWVESTRGILLLMEAADKNQLEKIAPQQFTKTATANAAMKLYGQWLQHMGEPAGPDFVKRAALVAQVYTQLAQFYRTYPPGVKFNDAAQREFGSNVAKRNAAYTKANKLVAEGKFEQAEQFVEETMADWRLRTRLLGPEIESVYYRGFNQAITQYIGPMERKRRTEAAASLDALRKQRIPQVDALLKLADEVVQQIGADGEADVAGKSLDGPAALRQLAVYWQTFHWKLVQAEGIEKARLSAFPEIRLESPELDEVRELHRKLTTGMAQAMARLIVSETERGTAELHARYNEAAASVVVNAQPKVARMLEQALIELGEASGLDGLGDYNIAMNDLLRWRRKSAAAKAQRLGGKYPTVATRLLTATKSRGRTMGLFPERGTAKYPELIGAAPEVIFLATTTADASLLAAPQLTTGNTAESQLVDRTYAVVGGDWQQWDYTAPLNQMKEDLLVDESRPPLTLAAAAAVHSAEGGGFALCGGAVERIVVRSLVQLQATLPYESWAIFPLGDLPQEAPPNYLYQAVLQAHVKPHWLQHDAFVYAP